jgi:hypothetical protein
VSPCSLSLMAPANSYATENKLEKAVFDMSCEESYSAVEIQLEGRVILVRCEFFAL